MPEKQYISEFVKIVLHLRHYWIIILAKYKERRPQAMTINFAKIVLFIAKAGVYPYTNLRSVKVF